MRIEISTTDAACLKTALRAEIPEVKSSHRAEALARALGWKTNAAMRAALAAGTAGCRPDPVAFSAYLGSRGFGGAAGPADALAKAFGAAGLCAAKLDVLPCVVEDAAQSARDAMAAAGMGWVDFHDAAVIPPLAEAHGIRTGRRTLSAWLAGNGVSLTSRKGLDEETAGRAFAGQLGPTWQGVGDAVPHAQAVGVLARLSGTCDRRFPRLRDGIRAACARAGSGAAPEISSLLRPFLAEPCFSRAIDATARGHAFRNPAIIRVFAAATGHKGWGGFSPLCAPASSVEHLPFPLYGCEALSAEDVDWLEPVDGTLWRCLSCMGDPSTDIGAAGAVSHFWAERAARVPLRAAQTDAAVSALLMALDDPFLSDPCTWHGAAPTAPARVPDA